MSKSKVKQVKIYNLDQHVNVFVSGVDQPIDCFYRAAFIQSCHAHFALKFGVLFRWEKLNGTYGYNPLWKEHVWAVDKLTGRLFDSHRAFSSVLDIEVPGIPLAKFNPKSLATLDQLDQIQVGSTDYEAIDRLHRKYKTEYLYLENSFVADGVEPEVLALRHEIASSFRNGKEFDFRPVLADSLVMQMALAN